MTPGDGLPGLDAEGVLFFGGHGAPPAFVPNHNTAVADVPLSVTATGGFAIYAAPRSVALAPGAMHAHVWIFNAAGQALGHTERLDTITFENGWSSSEFDYPMVGGCYFGQFTELEPGGPFTIRIVAVDEAQTTVNAEVLVQPSCALANGSATPEPTKTWAEQCREHCPGF